VAPASPAGRGAGTQARITRHVVLDCNRTPVAGLQNTI
jgi:hypothetical protein